MMIVFGLMFFIVGIDKGIGVECFIFGLIDLMDGFSFLFLVMVIFVFGEILMGILKLDVDNSVNE